MDNIKKIIRLFPITLLLIAVSGFVAIISRLGESSDVVPMLMISQYSHNGLGDVMAGQVWRLITPIFIHFGLMHLIFNMMWVWDLGRLIEEKKGALFYLCFIIVVGATSNLAQYLMTDYALFGGMSGVVYGLFAYVWIRGRVDRSFAAGLHKTTVNMMLIWFVLCWSGLLGNIANWAHTIGLLAGAVWAFAENGFTWSPSSQADLSQAHPQSLEYLSTTDMLQIESQRAWLREHYLPESRGKYDTIEGKLNIIDAILLGSTNSIFTVDRQRALEIVFADALTQETDAQWAIVVEGEVRTPVLIIPGSQVIVMPLVSFSQLQLAKNVTDLRQIFERTVLSIHQQKTSSS